MNESFVIVTTEHRGVFAGYATAEALEGQETSRRIKLRGAKMAIRFGCDRGVLQLAATGPTANSKIGAASDVMLHNVTAVFTVSEAARAAWDAR